MDVTLLLIGFLTGFSISPVFSEHTPVFEHNCEPVDYRQELGTGRDQIGTSWCFAHSAAELVTQATKVRVSAFDLAVTYLLADETPLKLSQNEEIKNYLKARPEFFNRLDKWRTAYLEGYHPEQILTESGLINIGGMDDDAILLGNFKGFCADEKLPSGRLKHAQYLEKIKRHHEKRDLTLDKFRSRKIGRVEPEKSRIAAHIFREWIYKTCEKRIFIEELLIPGSLYKAEDLEEYDRLVKQKKIDPVQVHSELFALVDKKLNQGHAVSIGFDVNDLYPQPGKTPWEGDHSSIIAARKKVGETCFYNLRFHYHDECQKLKPELKSSCSADGSVWVRAQSIPSIYAVLWLNKTKKID